MIPAHPGRVLSRALPLLLLLTLGGCITDRQEQEIGDSMAAEVNSSIPLVHDPILNAYVRRLGESIARVSDRPGLDYHFYIINSSIVNAFALPGGHIYVTRGLLEETHNGRELAGVLAHEIGHVSARHGVQKLQHELRTGSVVGILYNLILGGEPALLRRNSVELANVVWAAKHSRADETEADRLAVDYLYRAGIDPDGVVTLLQTLLKMEQEHPVPAAAEWFSTHPLTAERIAETRAEIAREKNVKPVVAPTEIPAYAAFLHRVSALPPPLDSP